MELKLKFNFLYMQWGMAVFQDAQSSSCRDGERERERDLYGDNQHFGDIMLHHLCMCLSLLCSVGGDKIQ